MKNARIIVKYRQSKLIPLYFVCLLFLGLLTTPFLLGESVVYQCLSALLIAAMVFLLFLGLGRRMKTLEIRNDQILIQTYLGHQHVFAVQDLYAIQKIGLSYRYFQRMKVVVFQHAANLEDILTCLLNALGIKNTPEALHHMLNSNFVMFTSEEDCNASINAGTKTQRVLFPVIVGLELLLFGSIFYGMVKDHSPVIGAIGVLLFVGLVAFCAIYFEKRIESIRGKAKRAFANILMYAACMILSVIISIGVYHLFLVFGIDLLALHF